MASISAIYNPLSMGAKAVCRRVVISGDTETEYVGEAPPYSKEADQVWRCFKIVRKTTSTLITEQITHTPGLVAVGAGGAGMVSLTYS